uniref:H-2 class II histocompatibility antigen, A-U alpha chain-like n=1 Tax=Erpetoichthys calabaricus TaxID=27687 RepID=A0A8C4X5I3_ERPCA
MCTSGSTETEDELQLDGDEELYADFINNKVVMTIPNFVDQFGADPGWMQAAQASKQVCFNDIGNCIKAEKNPPESKAIPRVVMYPAYDLEMGISNTLVCFVTGFYPIPIKLSWYKNSQPISDGVEVSRYYPNDDFTFQIFSEISFMPKVGDIYSCMVEHSSVTDLITTIWEPEMKTQSDAGKTAFCAIGLTLGLLGVAIGTFFLIKGNNCN